MLTDQKLSAVMKEFAHTLLTDLPTQAILDGLVERIVDVLPITSAGVTLIVPGANPEYVAASDPAALRYEKLQTELGEGPCLAAYESGDLVAVPDLREETRFPSFSPPALAAGLRAVFTFPLYNEAERFGALDLYRETPGALSAAATDAARTLADVTSVYLVSARTRHELQELGAAQSDFVSKISHELRSPLTSVLGYLELLNDGVSGVQDKEQLRMVGIIERNSRQLLGLIENLLTMSRAESGSSELAIDVVDLREVVACVRESAAPAIARGELELLISLDPDAYLNGDRVQLERALLNLVSNAIKFTTRGGRIEIRTRAEGDDIALSVRDNGIGVPIEEQGQLFKRFFRTSRSKEQQVPGTGLGLYIVHHIVELHGGTMRVASSPQGSTFTMLLPVGGPPDDRRDPPALNDPVLSELATPAAVNH